MPEKTRELKQLTEILHTWHSEEPVWIHLEGGPGSGKSYFITIVLKGILREYAPVFHLSFLFTSLPKQEQLKKILQSLLKNHKKDVETFVNKFPGYLQKAILKMFSGAGVSRQQEIYSHPFTLNLLKHFLRFLAANKKLIVVLDGGFDWHSLNSYWLLQTLLQEIRLPLIIISSASGEGRSETPPEYLHRIKMNTMSVQETQRLVQSYLKTNPLTARLITNQLQIKSRGNPRKVKYFLEAFYRTMLPDDPRKLIDNIALQKMRISSSDEVVAEQILKSFADVELALFIFLAHLIDPLPLKLFRKMLDQLQVNRERFAQWIKMGLLERQRVLGQEFVLIPDAGLKHFLRAHIGMEKAKAILAAFKPLLKSFRPEYPFQVSEQYFMIQDYPTAFSLAVSEARAFYRIRQYQRAYNRYSFVRRNAQLYPAAKVDMAGLLPEIGELQKSMGLFENAFESYREYRDGLSRADQSAWFSASLKMAEILLKMDALAEARYLLADLKTIKTASPKTRAFATMLFGDLEKNIGHPDYAVRYYIKALSFLHGKRSEKLSYRIYKKVREYYTGKTLNTQFEPMIESVLKCLAPESKYARAVRLDRVKYLISQNNYHHALGEALRIYCNLKQQYQPGPMLQVTLYLSEIYAFLGKWYLARSHLKRLLSNPLFLYNPLTKTQVLLNLAVVNKEIALYGEAIHLLREVSSLSEQQGFSHQLHESMIHLGHVQLLVHGHLKTREYLMEALQWAEENEAPDLIIMASLLLSSYELQRGRMKAVKEYLALARKNINRSTNVVDKLNYAYYLLQFLLRGGKIDSAKRIINFWVTKGKGISKFEMLANWFSAKIEYEIGNFGVAALAFEEALVQSRIMRLPQQEFQILKDMVSFSRAAGFREKHAIYSMMLQVAYQKLLHSINDEILRKQFQESKPVEEISGWGIALERTG